MPSLVDLKNIVEGGKEEQSIAPVSAPKKETYVKGDDLMAKAQGQLTAGDDEMRMAKLFNQSYEMVKQKMSEDSEYADRVSTDLKSLTGKKEAFLTKVIDEADQIKIDYLKQQNPEWFTSEKAGNYAFANSALFGQLSRIVGKAGELIDGRPYEQVVEEFAEKQRLLKKEFPTSSTIGDVAAFLVPGSPAKALFGKASQFGLKIAEKAGPIVAKMASNPKILQSAIETAAAGGAGAAAVSGVQGTLGTDLETINLDRGAENAVSNGAMGALIGGGIPLVAASVSKTAEVSAPYIRRGAKSANNAVGSFIEQLSGTPQKTLRAFSRNSSEIKAAAGKEAEIGDNLVDFLTNQKKSRLPELKLADDLLDQLPEVNPKGMVNYLRSVKTGTDPKLDSQVGLLNEWATRIEKKLGTGDKVNARAMREVIDDLQEAASDAFGKESNLYVSALKQASRIGRLDLVNTAKTQGGEVGQTYSQLMEKASEKVGVLKFIGKQLGRDLETQNKRAESFVSNIFGKNKDLVQQRLSDLDSKFGTNFLEQARNANYAKQLGDSGSPKVLSNLATGKALLGTVTGGAIGGPSGAVLGAAASSPRVGAAVLGASDKITGFVNRMVANPDAIARLAGRLSSKPGNEKMVAQLRVPMEVRKLANEIYTSLTKDGPISAASTTRVIADTPYFIGLVHYFDVAERKMKSNNAVSGIARERQYQQSEIATPNQ